MRSWDAVTAAVFAVVVAASTAVADPPQPPPAGSPPVLGFYPQAALAAGVGGEATLLCARTEHGALVDCKLREEQPTGQGFGAAALALAAQSVDGCGRSLP